MYPPLLETHYAHGRKHLHCGVLQRISGKLHSKCDEMTNKSHQNFFVEKWNFFFKKAVRKIWLAKFQHNDYSIPSNPRPGLCPCHRGRETMLLDTLLHSTCYLRTTCLLSASFLRHFSLTVAGLRAPLSRFLEGAL